MAVDRNAVEAHLRREIEVLTARLAEVTRAADPSVRKSADYLREVLAHRRARIRAIAPRDR